MTRPSSLRRRLTGFIAGGSVITALIAASGFSWLDLNHFWERTSADVSAVANIVASQAGAALVFGDEKAAQEILASLRADERIRDVILYSAKGACFSAFHRAGGGGCQARPRDGIRREADTLVVVRGVVFSDERVGTLLLTASIPSMWVVLGRYLGGAALILVLSLAVAGALAIVLQARVSAPILSIARVARRMAETHRFDERVEITSSDEVGVLAQSFNTMLEEIGRRDAALERQRQQLEQEVSERSLVNAELRKAKDKAEEAARLKSEFLANMSHEIRTPLNGVTGMIGLALEHCANPEECEQLRVAQSAAQSLTSILNDILDFSKIEAGKLAIESIDFDLHSTVRECVKIFEVTAAGKGLSLSLDIPTGCPARVRGDPMRLRQVLINLVGNAVKFTIEGEVAVSVRQSFPGTLQFEVRDTGIGIPKEKLDSIFDAFIQADGSHTRRFGGTGLGLTITRRLAGLMGGKLWAESELGRGSRFFVELPLETRDGIREAADTPNELQSVNLPPLHVLVAEDNIVNQKVVCGILRRKGWTTCVAANGQEAFASFLKDRFDVVLMDIQMPDVDGLEATELIRKEERNRSLPRIPIIALTAHASKAQHDQCIARGMDAVVTKPVDVRTLFKSIAEVLEAAGEAVR